MTPTYTPEQVTRFLDLLAVPSSFRSHASSPTLAFLRLLHTHMLSTIPYETLDLHYTAQKQIQLDPEALFQKLVADGRGRGGYCLENNQLFLYMLRDLGFDVYPVGAKIRPRVDGVPQGEYMCWVHIVHIVKLPDGSRWMVDVCFGGDGPTQPIPLEEGATILNMGTQEARLTRDFMPGQMSRDPAHRMWHYQCRNGETLPWTTFYVFSDAVEWLPPDFGLINCFTGVSKDSHAVTTVLMVKFLRRTITDASGDDKGDREEIFGKRMLVKGVVKENLGGKTKIVEECKTEDERIAALKSWFGVELTVEEREAIKGHPSELK